MLYLCDGIACGLPRCQALAAYVKQLLGLGMNQRTADGSLQIRTLRCREHAAAMPILGVDEEQFEILDFAQVDDLLGEYLAKE